MPTALARKQASSGERLYTQGSPVWCACYRTSTSKSDLNLTGIETDKWEPLAADRNGWRHAVNSGVKSGERMRILRLEEKREQRKAKQQNVEVNPPLEFVCNRCGRDCHARIGLLSHSKRCSRHVQQD